MADGQLSELFVNQVNNCPSHPTSAELIQD
jgi:hypothetical protein